ncbi:MAG: FkbM family methyltransferase [Bacteroidales bacterium]
MNILKVSVMQTPRKLRRCLRRVFYRLSIFSYDHAIDENTVRFKRKLNLYFRLFSLRRKKFKVEIDFINNKSDPGNLFSFVFPYQFVFDYDHNQVKVFKDEERDMFYVLHKGHRLYYSRDFKSENDIKLIYNGIRVEQDVRSPHRYLTDEFNVEENDVVVDIGAAEGNFSLDVVERARRLYIFESDANWSAALHATFEPWKEKVHIINKYVSGIDSKDSVTLDSMLGNRHIDFIKMDAEGAEPLILKGSENILRNHKSLRLALCTYHRKHDAEKCGQILSAYNYAFTFSEGHILFIHTKLAPPYFRKGLMRAQKSGN